MSTAYELEGRIAQKQRTRRALVDAARDLVAAGATPTIEDAAKAASISRTTAYRYFANQRELLAAAHPETSLTSLLPPNAPRDPVERVRLAIKAFTKSLLENESQQRTMLRLSLQQEPGAPSNLPLRQGRAIAWLTDALEPAREQLGDAGLKRLVFALRSATGIEALVWLTDIAGLSRREAVKLMQWSAEALCRQALTETTPRRTS